MKTIIINDETHRILKEFTKKNSIKLNAWVDKLILSELERLNADNKKV